MIFKYDINWTYQLSPKLSDYLNKYKVNKQGEYLTPPERLERGKTTTTDLIDKQKHEAEYKELIKEWALEVYDKWNAHHSIVDEIAKGFLDRK